MGQGLVSTVKTCPKCKQELSLDLFYKTKDNLASPYCKSCQKQYRKELYRIKIEKELKLSADYRKNNRNIINEKARKRWKETYGDETRAIMRATMRKRRAGINEKSPYTEEQVLAAYGNECYLCNNPIDLSAPRWTAKPGWQNGLHIDHLIPVSKGGPDTLENVRPTHGLCNTTKNRFTASSQEIVIQKLS